MLSSGNSIKRSNNIKGVRSSNSLLARAVTSLFYKVHEEYGTRVAEGLGLDVAEVKQLAKT